MEYIIQIPGSTNQDYGIKMVSLLESFEIEVNHFLGYDRWNIECSPEVLTFALLNITGAQVRTTL